MRTNLMKLIKRRFNLYSYVIIISMIILSCSLFYLQVLKKAYYLNRLNTEASNIIYEDEAARGRIYDTFGRVIVDNKYVNNLVYRKKANITVNEEIEIAKKLSEILDIDYGNLTKNDMKEFWLVSNPEVSKKLVTEHEKEFYNLKKLDDNDIKRIKLYRISDEDIAYDEKTKKICYIYKLMNSGFYKHSKIIKKEIDESLINKINDLGIEGLEIRKTWKRIYPYGSVLKNILGTISYGIPEELKKYYIDLGYDLNDIVGSSYLELQYNNELKGTKNKYKVLNDGNLELLEEGTPGNDIVLTIDIELQKEIEEILKREIIYTLEHENQIYYNRSYAILTEPKTGSILTMAGIQVINKDGNYDTYDYSAGIVTSPVTVGSAIKAASHIVGYNNKALLIGEKRDDECIKIAATPVKCSWRRYGLMDDIGALKYSSNVYQFYTAMKVGKAHYKYNSSLKIDESAFDIYRKTFAMFGLGVSTGIDLPLESYGFKGSSRLPGHLLDFAIGQYDTYTPLELSQYVDTLANDGVRVKKHLLKEIYYPSEQPLQKLKYSYDTTVMNKVLTDDVYMARVKEGLKEVMSSSGTGYGYVDKKYNPAGKTGTSESFIDTDNDGVIDTETLSNTFVSYAPYDEPRITFTIISPDIGYYRGGNVVRSYVNRRISYEVSKKYFEIYE